MKGARTSYVVSANGETWSMTWHPAGDPPDGRPHGAAGVCVTQDGDVVLISGDGKQWDLPAGRPEDGETWEETLRREVDEEACVTVTSAQLIGYARGECTDGPYKGEVIVRSFWRADVIVNDWLPQFEIAHRLVAKPTELRRLITHLFAPTALHALREARVLAD